MGAFAGTVVRLLLASIVLAVPTVLMGGTLPAMARFAVSDEDGSRRGLALLYGMNTLGAVAGAVSGTFFLFERFGNHTTLYIACVLNAGVAGLAWFRSRGETLPETAAPRTDDAPAGAAAPLPLVLLASAATGFVFLLMELVWYRMLSPIFGGTAFTLRFDPGRRPSRHWNRRRALFARGRKATSDPKRFRLHLRAGSAFCDNPLRAGGQAGSSGDAPSTTLRPSGSTEASWGGLPCEALSSFRQPSWPAFSSPFSSGCLVEAAPKSGPKPASPTRGIRREQSSVGWPAALDSSLLLHPQAHGSWCAILLVLCAFLAGVIAGRP